MRLELSREADADIVDMLNYGTKSFGWAAAEAYAQSFDPRFELLIEHPQIGMAHPELRPNLRSLPHHSHRIYYSVEGEVLIVRRVLHKAMDVGRWLR